MNKFLLSLLLPLLFLSQPCPLPASGLPSLAPQIVRDGKLQPFTGSLPDIVVAANGNGVRMVKDQSTIQVKKCSEYIQAKDKGYQPPTNADMADESFFAHDCAPQLWFAKVKAAKTSFVHDFRFDSKILQQLPPIYLDGDSYIGDQIKKGLAEGSSVVALDPSFKLTKVTPFKIDFENKYDSFTMSILGFGDFTGSGYEEILSYYASHSKGGTGRSYGIHIFTRKEGDPVLRVAGPSNSWFPTNLNATFKSCSADRWLDIRKQALAQYKASKFAESEAQLNQFHSSCYSSLGWPQQLWLLSDLMLTQYKLGKFDACLELLQTSGVEKASEFGFEEGAKKAILHNKALCMAKK